MQERETSIQKSLLQHECGNAVAQQAADTIGPLEHGDEVPRPIQLIGRRESRRTRADHRHPLARARRRRRRRDPTLVERTIDNRRFDGFDRDRGIIDAQHARAFARRRTQAAGELREIVGRMQALDRRAPVIAIDEIVPVGNEITERASLMAERNAAVHAPGRLALERPRRIRQVNLEPVADALRDGTRRLLRADDFQKSGRLTHGPHPTFRRT